MRSSSSAHGALSRRAMQFLLRAARVAALLAPVVLLPSFARADDYDGDIEPKSEPSVVAPAAGNGEPRL